LCHFFLRRKKAKKEERGSFVAKDAEREKLISAVIDAGFRLHKELGPGLLESVYEAVFARRLERMGIITVRQMPVSIQVDGMEFKDAYRVDLYLENWLVVELKALEKLAGVHIRQAQTYVKLLNQPTGLILNFGAETFGEGVRRIYNNH
jgi:GxxExxY protein